MARSKSSLADISPDDIRPNPDNPRIIFREDELRELYESIREVGVRVPISVYQDRTKYTLLDGERRWRCVRKLNLKTIPALIQPKPDHLENLLMMFNIHNVRVQWDPLPTAYKLQEIKKMLEKEGKSAGPHSLAGITGLSVASVNRSFELLRLPKKTRMMLMDEAKKPKGQQRFNVDVFIEINKAARAIERHAPEVFEKVPKSKFVKVMFSKYKNKVEKNVVNFRNISKIVRAEKVGTPKRTIVPIITKLVENQDYCIEDAYRDSVKLTYELSDLTNKVLSLAEGLKRYRRRGDLPEELKRNLHRLRKELDRLLGTGR